MKRLTACTLAAVIAAGLACASGSRHPTRQKLLVIGFDGMDPDLVERWMNEGKLPTFARLARDGGFHRLETTPSPTVAQAWASFATGVNAGRHGVFDLLRRDPATYVPDLAMLRHDTPRGVLDAWLGSRPQATSRRDGTSFWVTAGRNGVRSSVVGVPLTFPPEDVPNGELLSGFPLPQLDGSMGAYHYFATSVAPASEGRTERGGLLQHLRFDAGRARATLAAVPDRPVPFTVDWNHDARSANIEIQGQAVYLLERQWSRWIDVEARINLLTRVRGMVQFYLIDAGQQFEMYASPVHWHPAAPPAPMSSPLRFAADLHDRLGTYRTLGWPATAAALADGRLNETAFMEDLERAFTDRTEIVLNRIESADWDLLVGVMDETDSVQHVMWRLIDPSHPRYDPAAAHRHGSAIERTYRRADLFVQQLLERVDADTTVMIVSAYGFQPFHSAVNLNSWLVERGYMTLRQQPPARRTLRDLSGGTFWENVDWSKTRAYAVGFGQVFVNLAGREGKGIVHGGREHEQLLDSLIIDLMNFHDERTYDRVVAAVYKRGELYAGPHVSDAADLIVAFESGYRVSLQSALGGTPAHAIETNATKWSGDHQAADYRATAGVLITNRKVLTSTPRVIDIAPTVLKHFGLRHADLDGVPLF